MRIDDMYDQGAEGAGGGAVEEEGDEQKPNDDDKPSVSHLCFHSQPHKWPCCHHKSVNSSKVIVPSTCNGNNTFTCISSVASAGETSTQVEMCKKIEHRQIK